MEIPSIYDQWAEFVGRNQYGKPVISENAASPAKLNAFKAWQRRKGYIGKGPAAKYLFSGKTKSGHWKKG